MAPNTPQSRPASVRILDDVMQQKLNHDKIQIRIENEHYLRNHPEIKHILDYFMKQVLINQPADLQTFASALFSDQDLRVKVEKHRVESEQAVRDIYEDDSSRS